jgi:hypothetical protein
LLTADELLLTGGFRLHISFCARTAHFNILGRLATLAFALGGNTLVFGLLRFHRLKRILERLLGILWLIHRVRAELNGFIIRHEIVPLTALTRLFFACAAGRWIVNSLFEDAYDVEILLVKQDPLLLQVVRNQTLLLPNRL